MRASALGLHHRVRQANADHEPYVDADPVSRRAAVLASAVLAFGSSHREAAEAISRATWRLAMEGTKRGPKYADRWRLQRIASCMYEIVSSGEERAPEELVEALDLPAFDTAQPDCCAVACLSDLLHERGPQVREGGLAWSMTMETFHYLEQVIVQVFNDPARAADDLALDILERLALARI